MKKHLGLTTFLSVAACKITRNALRLGHRGGTTLPGRAAMVFDKRILEVVSRDMEIIVVTGTNGKTTTCSMLRNALQESGIEPLSNISGANLLTGVTAEFTSNATLSGRPKKKYAIIECDEGALKKVVPLIKPKVIVVTNLFRDQLDRYGEVMHTLEEIRRGVSLVPDSTLCLNADCSLTSSLAKDVPNKVYYYGIGKTAVTSDAQADELSDAKYCINCGTEYKYEYHTYAHLGGFYCPNCGYKRMTPDLEIEFINISAKGSDIKAHFKADDNIEEIHIGLPALYNVYNAIAAIGAYEAASWNKADITRSLANVSSSFGRMETFTYNNVDIQMILVKNPAGCNQSLSYLSSLGEDYIAVFCLNDKHEKVAHDPHCKHIYVSGTRATDMQVRLKYADAAEDHITLIEDNNKLLEQMTSHNLPVFILPNYTSMLALRAVVGAATGKKEFWKDQKA